MARNFGESAGGENVYGFFDDDDGIDCIFEAAVKCGFIKQPTDPSKAVYELLHGTYQEARNFMTRKPLFFFVRYNVGTIINGELTSIQRCVAPVCWKEAHYYMYWGREIPDICRIIDPAQVFFTGVGQKLLTHFISLPFKNDHNLSTYPTSMQYNKELSTTYYASCALCNALQDPTFVNNANFHIVGKKFW